MIEIKGAYANAVVFADSLEASAAGQIKAFCDQPVSAGSKIRIMPDVHADGYEEKLAKGEPQKQLSKEFVRQWLIEHNFMNEPGQTTASPM